MKLLMISTDRNIFDKNSAVAQRQIEYADRNEETHIVVFTPKGFSEITLSRNIWVYPTRSSSKWMYIFDALRIARFIAKKRNITSITCQDPFETGLVGVLAKKNHMAELELQVHTDISSPYFQHFNFLNRIRMFISKYTLKNADTVRVVSERIKKYVSKYIDQSKITVRPISVDTEKIRNAPIIADLHKKYPQFSKIVLMISRLEKEKNIDMAVRAFRIVLEKAPRIGLVIVGSGSEENKIKTLAEKIGIKDSVIFENWQNDLNQVASYYKTCDCFLVSSWYEGYGMTLVEAHASGAPIVSTDVGVAREVGAEIVEHTPEDISRGIIHIIS